MLQVIDQHLAQAFDVRAWLSGDRSPVDVVVALTSGLSSAWEVMSDTDPLGVVSIVVMPACDDPDKPTFLLYEKDGQAQVATIRNDVWESDQAFDRSTKAVAAVIASALRVS